VREREREKWGTQGEREKKEEEEGQKGKQSGKGQREIGGSGLKDRQR
jgi:hypothetical protein